MLLRELLLHLGLNEASFLQQVSNPTRGTIPPIRIVKPHSLDQIGQFEFGERYAIVMLSGVRVDVRQLDIMLGVVKSEFLVADTYDMTLHLAGNKTKSLILRPKNELGRPWGRNIAQTCRNIQDWVTIYNLSGEWPEEIVALPRPKRQENAAWTS